MRPYLSFYKNMWISLTWNDIARTQGISNTLWLQDFCNWPSTFAYISHTITLYYFSSINETSLEWQNHPAGNKPGLFPYPVFFSTPITHSSTWHWKPNSYPTNLLRVLHISRNWTPVFSTCSKAKNAFTFQLFGLTQISTIYARSVCLQTSKTW